MQVGTATDVGRVRSRNEDALLADPARGVFAVADGLGGHAAGDVASRMAIEALEGALPHRRAEHGIPEQELVTRALQRAHHAVADGADRAERLGMATTAVVVVLSDAARALIAHVGDSRAYLVHEGDVAQLTRDHTTGEWGGRGRITQALGLGDIEPDVQEVELEPGDRLLLCTDGLTDMLDDEDIATMFAVGGEPQDVCDRLVEAALMEGGIDNITVIVIDPV